MDRLKHTRGKRGKRIRNGIGQLTLVEHALCPLDARVSSASNLMHEASFRYSDKQGKRKTATARVFCPLGLTPKDELLLWGLLAITMADPQTDGELHATRHYCLRKLGIVDARRKRGGRQYDDFTAAIERLAAIRYQCDAMYDPIRAEHRRVGFGFFSYSLPLCDDSSRAWRFVWDPVFFELAKAAGGYLRFDLDVYRQLDSASRRLYLFLAKLFFRRRQSPRLDVVEVAEQIVGVAASVSPSDKRAKLAASIDKLAKHGVVGESKLDRIGKGRFIVVFERGPLFDKPRVASEFESPLLEPLLELGFDTQGAHRTLRRYDHRQVREWLDITLAARERFGSKFFRKSPAAFLTDNLKHAAAGKRTPPDWWWEVRKAEQRATVERARKRRASARNTDQLTEKAIATLDHVHASIFSTFLTAGQSEGTARVNVKRFMDEHDRRRRSNDD